MHTYLINPLAPLVLRTGRPFGETGGGDSFPFPLPSTVGGTLRTARADASGLDFRTSRKTILGWAAGGVLPAQIHADGGVAPLFPKPMDAYYTAPQGRRVLHRMAPLSLGAEEGCDLPDQEDLLPVFLPDDKSKPTKGPAWWTLDAMTNWLLGKKPDAATLGYDALPSDARTHVSIEPQTLAAHTGQLFQSSGPEFEAQRLRSGQAIEERGWQADRFGLLALFAEELDPTLVRLGGDGRLSALDKTPDAWPDLPAELESALNQATRIRLVLATPALFSTGWRPGWLASDLTGECPAVPGLKLKLRAAAVDRWQPMSGWDIDKRKPKAIRRLAPTGSVYWFEVLKAPEGWAQALWLNTISDDPSDRQDGFGLVVPGLWN